MRTHFPYGRVGRAMAIAILSACQHVAFAQPAMVDVVVPESGGEPGKTFSVRLEYLFDGASLGVGLGPPDIPEVEWGTIALREARGELDESGHKIVQVLDITADSEGEFDVPSLRSPYLDPAALPVEPQEGAGEEPALPTLSSPSFRIDVRERTSPTLLYGGIGAVCLVGIGGIVALYRSRGRASGAAPRSASPVNAESARNALHTAKKHRLDGDFYSYFVALRDGAVLFRGTAEGDSLYAKLDDWANRTGYGDRQPSNEDVDGVQRDYERALQEFERRIAEGSGKP